MVMNTSLLMPLVRNLMNPYGPTFNEQYLEGDVPKFPCTLESVGSIYDA